jgi:hypothetical protein
LPGLSRHSHGDAKVTGSDFATAAKFSTDGLSWTVHLRAMQLAACSIRRMHSARARSDSLFLQRTNSLHILELESAVCQRQGKFNDKNHKTHSHRESAPFGGVRSAKGGAEK